MPDTHVAQPWLQRWWDYEQPCDELRLYTDGSFAKRPVEGEAHAGAAVSAFVSTPFDWAFAGAMSTVLPSATSAYVTELSALAAALKLTYDFLKLHLLAHGCVPHVTICHDATTVGRQAEGDWNCISHPLLGRFVRSMALLVRERFGNVLRFEHVFGHTGDPGNELVDYLATRARGGIEFSPFMSWLPSVTSKEFVADAEWFWILFSAEYATYWSDGHLAFPAPLHQEEREGRPVDPLLPHATEPDQAPETASISLRLATCNVLTLKGQQETEAGLSGIARQRALFRQMDEERILLFGLQETRLQKLHQAYDENFFIYKSAATKQGQCGLIAGFSKLRPYGVVHGAGTGQARKLYFRDEHFSVLAFDPRHLIIRVTAPFLRIVVIVAHAPHSGAEVHELDQWWAALKTRFHNNLLTGPLSCCVTPTLM